MRNLTNVVVIIVFGVILADLVQPAHIGGTNTLLGGVSGLWRVGVNGMLGKTTKNAMVP